MSHKLLVLVPYRNRKNHLDIFVEYLHDALKSQKIYDFSLSIIEQSDGTPFNRGLLLNSGFYFFSNTYDYICLHDIDMIGEPFDYSYSDTITHLSARQKDRDYQEWYSGYLGGTTLFPTEIFKNINGFSNDYWGWGCEDDDLKIRCTTYGYKIHRRQCRYYQLPHEKSGRDNNKNDETYKNNFKKLKTFRENSVDNKIKKIQEDGINQVINYISSYSIENKKEYRKLYINI